MPAPWTSKDSKAPPLVANDQFMILDSGTVVPVDINKRVTLTTVQANLVTNVNANNFNINNLSSISIRDVDTNTFTISSSVNLAANRTINLPLLTGDDTFVFENFIQSLTNKTFTGTTNQFENTALRIEDTTGTPFIYTIKGSSLDANHTVILPDLTADDTFALLGVANVFTESQSIQSPNSTSLTVFNTSTPTGGIGAVTTGLIASPSSIAFVGAQTGQVNMLNFVGASISSDTASVIPIADTLEINGAPFAGANVTITESFALNVASGATKLGFLSQKTNNTTAVHEMEANHTTPANDQIIGQIDFIDDDDGGARTTYGKIRTLIEDPTSPTEDGQMFLSVIKAGTLTDYITINENNNDSIDFKGKNVVGISGLTLTSTLNMSNATAIQWAANADRRIFNNAAGFIFEVESGDTFSWEFAGALDMRLVENQLQLNGSSIAEVNFLGFTGTEANAGTIRLNVSADISWRNVGDTNDNGIRFSGDQFAMFFDGAAVDYQFSSTRADFVGNNLINVGFLESNATNPASAGTIRLGNTETIEFRNFANDGDLGFGLTASDTFLFDADIDLSSSNLRNAGFVESNATNPATSGAIRLGNGERVVSRNLANDNNLEMGFDTSDRFIISIDTTTEYTFNSSQADFLANNLINVGFFESNAGTPAGSGAIRLGNTETIEWRNAGDSADLGFGLTASDTFLFDATIDLSSNNLSNVGILNLNAATLLTIVTGAVTITQSYHRIDTEASAATDDLDTINGGTEGDILIIRAEDSARTVSVTEAGNIRLSATPFALDNVEDTLSLLFDGSNWLETSRSNNGA